MNVPYILYIALMLLTLILFATLFTLSIFKRKAKKIIRMQEELVLDGNYKAVEMTTGDVQELVNKTHVTRLVMLTVFALLFLSLWVSVNWFNMADDIKLIVDIFKWW